MDSIAVWMNNCAKHKILMQMPQSDKKANGKTILLSPLK
jgi:hypothetical protein